MYRGRPLHETNSKPSQFRRKKKRESCLERELHRNRRYPPKPPRPRTSKRKMGTGVSECHKKEDGPETIPLDLPLFQDFFDSLPLKCNDNRKPQVRDNLDGWESELEDMLNDGPHSLDQALLHALTASINPLAAFKKIKQVALLATPVRSTKKVKQSKTYHQALLFAALITGDTVSATESVYCSHKDDCVPIVIDTGASISVTPVITDLLGPLRPCATANLKGLSGTTEVIGEGTVNWLVRDMFGNKRKIRTTAYYILEASICILSPQTYFKEKKAGSLQITHDRMTLTLKDGSRLDFPYQDNNLPLMLTYEHFTRKALTVGLTFEDATVMVTMDVTEEKNQNLTAPQRELMLWHPKWAHCDMGRVQTLLTTPWDTALDQLIEPKHAKESLCLKPKCAACCLSKTGLASAPTTQVLDTTERNLNDAVTNPGDVVHLDNYMSGFPGRLPTTFGKEKPKKKYTGGTIFVDGKPASSTITIRSPYNLEDIARKE
jgi:hypothetical protein